MTALYPYVWQYDHWGQLSEVLTKGRLPHAVLFAGPAGIGKRRFVQAFGALNLCHRASGLSERACGECRSCILFAAKSHPDFLLIAPEENSRAVKVDQVRALTEFVYKTSQLGGKKIAVIDPAEAMNTNAANALLKVLEEPGAETFLFLVSDAPGRLLSTIRSRCLQVSFPVPQEGETLGWLGQVTGSAEKASELSRLCGGRPVAALALHEGNALAIRDALANIWLSLWQRRPDPVFIAARWAEHDVEHVLDWASLWLQDLARWRVGVEKAVLADASVCLRLMEGSASEDLPSKTQVFRLLDHISDLKRQLASGANPNKQLLFESLAAAFVSKHRH